MGAAAGVATAAIGVGGLSIIEAATFSGLAAGGITGGGNAAIQGGSGADIFAGAVGGALIGRRLTRKHQKSCRNLQKVLA